MIRNPYIEGLSLPPQHPFHQDAVQLTRAFETRTIKSNGVLRWKESHRVPPQEILDFWKHIGKRFNMQKSVQARNREDRIFMERYKHQQDNRQRTPEEIHEMRNAFGEGTTVVDIITGKRIRL